MGFGIRENLFRIPDPGFKKAPDPGSKTLVFTHHILWVPFKEEKQAASEEIVFCDETCYFRFSVTQTGSRVPDRITNLNQLEEYQTQLREQETAMLLSGDGDLANKEEEDKGPKFKGIR
jgi:hypothetical protein